MARNATTASARAGYDIYKKRAANISLDDINTKLQAAGFDAVSPRMYDHYRHLFNAGYDRYVSINRFDVAHASQPYEGTGPESRYLTHPLKSGATVTFVRRDQFYEAEGFVDEVSEAGALLRFARSAQVAALAKSKVSRGDQLLVSIGKTKPIAARAIDVEKHGSALYVEVEFTQLQSIEDYVGKRPLATKPFVIQATATDDHGSLAADVAGRRVYYVLEVVDAVRALANAVLVDADDLYVEPTEIESLKIASPLEAVVGLPPELVPVLGTATSVLGIYGLLQRVRWAKGRADSKQGEALGQHEDVREKRLKNDLLEAEVSVQVELMKQMKSKIKNADVDDGRVQALIHHQMFPALERLSEQGIREIDLRSRDDQEVDLRDSRKRRRSAQRADD